MIVADEIQLARAYERRRLPKNIRFPRTGDIYQAIDTIEINYLTAHHAPFTGGGKAMLPKGEQVRVYKISDDRPISVYCDPMRYDELHSLIVPAEERENPYYSNYYFWIETTKLVDSFELVACGLAESSPA